MSDPTDIVARLRGAWLPNDTLSIIRDEAADEIERLRKERDDLNRLVEELYDDKFQGGGLWQRCCEESEL